MPTRAIPLNSRSLTGIISSPKIIGTGSFESSLERDFLMLLIFDTRVTQLEVQPFQIPWTDFRGDHIYTPDVFARYSPYHYEDKKEYSIIYEVKYRTELHQSWKKLYPKFKQAHRFAREHGWKFKIITDKEIRTPYLENIKFLSSYYTLPPDERFLMVLNLFEIHGEITVKEVVNLLSSTLTGRAEILTLIWTMLANHYLQTNLAVKLNQNSVLWVTQP